MAGVFSSQVVTVAGRSLIASATATNQIVFVKALSATTVPADPSVTTGYDGVQGTIASSSATNNVARVVTSYTNAPTSAPQPVKAIALMGRLASQSDSEAVIFAYCTDSGSEIYFPGNNAPAQLTRFAYNIAFEGTAPLEVTEAGAASLSDLDRFVSLHRAGDPTRGEDQTIFGDKYWYGQQDFDEACRFYNAVVTHSVWPETDNKYSLGLQRARYNAIYGETVNGMSIDVCSASTAVSGKASLTYVDDALVSSKDFVPANTDSGTQTCGRLSRPWRGLYVRDAVTFVGGSTSEAQCATLYDDEGALVLSPGHDLRLGTTWGAHGSIYGAPMGVSSERHTPSTLPNSTTSADAPTWDIEKGAIVMAMPCWATARDVFMNRMGAGDTITVTFPDVASAPFQHGSSYDNDPEKGAWYIASWKYGSGNSPKSMFIPLSTRDSSTDNALFSYLPAGTYRLLSGVEECVGVEHIDYHPEGMCVLLQKIS